MKETLGPHSMVTASSSFYDESSWHCFKAQSANFGIIVIVIVLYFNLTYFNDYSNKQKMISKQNFGTICDLLSLNLIYCVVTICSPE